jgi:thiamine biosynthesis lipoprotein ApbE
MTESIERRLAGRAPSLRFPEPVTLDEIRKLFPAAARWENDGARQRVLKDDGTLLGYAARTSPWSDNVSGYRGPTETLVGLKPDGQTIAALRIRKSFDTPEYVDTVKEDEFWMNEVFVGKTIDWLTKMDYERDKIEGVSGATLTSWAMAEGLKHRFSADQPSRVTSVVWRPHDWGLVAVVVGALIMTFSHLRGNKWIRRIWQAILIGYVGLVSGDLLSVGLFAGWAQHGVAWRTMPGLCLLFAVALLTPWTSRRQLYCHHLCPHGAAQQWLGGITKKKWRLPPRVATILELLPYALLGLALVATLRGWPLDLTNIEPFDAWAWRAAGAGTIAVAVVGLIVSIRIPQAYCRYGCPTGALLEMVRRHGRADQFGRRDWVAAGLLVLAFVARPSLIQVAAPQAEFRGRAMGTTWCVKLDQPAPASLQKEIEACLERVENLASNWRATSDVSRFNNVQSTAALPAPAELAWLVAQSRQVSQASDGAFDITVAPLVKLWGFGPGGKGGKAPDVAALTAAQRLIGWQKVQAFDAPPRLQKSDAALTVDLSSIAEGWAVDQIYALLAKHGHARFLVEAGGELRSRGVWEVGIERPSRVVQLSDLALSTSGTYHQRWDDHGQERSHIIDPRSGAPVTHDTVAVTVAHASCALADVWSTALLVLGAEEGLRVAEREQLAASFVTAANSDSPIVSSAWAATFPAR